MSVLQALSACGVPGVDEAAQRPLRLHGPDRVRVCLGAVLVVAQDVSRARLVPGDVLPPGVEIILVTVGDHDPGEARQDPGVFHGVQAAGAQPEGGVPLGERAVDILLLPGRPGPQRRLIEPRDRRGGDQGADQPHHLCGQPRSLPQARMDEPGRDGSAGHVGDQLPAPLHRDVLEDDQVNGQRPQPRPDRQGRVRHARPDAAPREPGRRRTSPGAGRAAPAPPARPGSPPADTTGQLPGQRRLPGPGRTRTRPADSGPRPGPGPPSASRRPASRTASPASASCPPPAPRPAAASAAASGPAGHPSSAASRSSRCSATPRAPPQPTAPAGQRPLPPAPRSAAPAPGSAHHADPPAAQHSQAAIIPDTTLSHHGNTTPAAKT